MKSVRGRAQGSHRSTLKWQIRSEKGSALAALPHGKFKFRSYRDSSHVRGQPCLALPVRGEVTWSGDLVFSAQRSVTMQL